MPSPVATELSTEHAAAIADLRRGAEKLGKLGIGERQQLLLDCVAGVAQVWEEWVSAAWQAKRISPGDAACAEDITTGPVPTLRYLWLMHQTLDDIKRHGKPRLPAQPYEQNGHLRVPVFPTRNLYDRLMFGPIKAYVRMPKDTNADDLFGDGLKRATGGMNEPPSVALILGAGNISSIPITDALTKIFQDNQAVLLKMNPVNEYVGPLFERAFRPLVDAGLLRIVYGGSGVGAALIAAEGVDRVHITGSDRTHDAIVWGGSEQEQSQRKAAKTPKLDKPITSELGNVSPWIVVPGQYTERQLRFQAENVVASVTSNASFNCIATKMLITSKTWPQRELFLKLIDETLARSAKRFAYYPGAKDRYAKFAGDDGVPNDDSDDSGILAWRFRRGVSINEEPHLCKEESFVCVFGETSLDGESPTEFLNHAVDFANDQMWGTLAAALTVPRDFERTRNAELNKAVDRLKYGVVGINQWPGVAFALMSTPWGAFPGATLDDIQSGIGSVHNTFLLNQPEQSVISSPLTIFPKPMWFSTHRCAESVARSLVNLYLHRTPWRIPPVLFHAMRG
ncbi:aldehyde dehydrogenase family protein [Rubripirellula tenax]|uniref:aldehyde dehydrogenase family protein n=1 Tax=Rubripirellula tenax TaxID=2528015 RepID=UPI0011B845BC|nr:aldehyde dehydrogenase family protein [Rubripirellula tenax]